MRKHHTDLRIHLLQSYSQAAANKEKKKKEIKTIQTVPQKCPCTLDAY